MNFVKVILANVFHCCKKGAYSYVYIDNWEKLGKIFLLRKRKFYSNLNKEDIT